MQVASPAMQCNNSKDWVCCASGNVLFFVKLNLVSSYLWTVWMTNIHRDTIHRALGYTSTDKVKEFNSCKLTSHPQVPPLMRDVLYLTAVLNRSCSSYIQCWIGTEISNRRPWPYSNFVWIVHSWRRITTRAGFGDSVIDLFKSKNPVSPCESSLQLYQPGDLWCLLLLWEAINHPRNNQKQSGYPKVNPNWQRLQLCKKLKKMQIVQKN